MAETDWKVVIDMLYRTRRLPNQPEENQEQCQIAVDSKYNTRKPNGQVWDAKQKRYRTRWIVDKHVFKQCKHKPGAYLKFMNGRDQLEYAVNCCVLHANRLLRQYRPEAQRWMRAVEISREEYEQIQLRNAADVSSAQA